MNIADLLIQNAAAKANTSQLFDECAAYLADLATKGEPLPAELEAVLKEGAINWLLFHRYVKLRAPQFVSIREPAVSA